jgi:hypothetical protein
MQEFHVLKNFRFVVAILFLHIVVNGLMSETLLTEYLNHNSKENFAKTGNQWFMLRSPQL